MTNSEIKPGDKSPEGIFLTPIATDPSLCDICAEKYNQSSKGHDFTTDICEPMYLTKDMFYKLSTREISTAVEYARSLGRCMFYKLKK